MPSESKKDYSIIVVAPTFYASQNETRYLLGVEACKQAAHYQVPLILVDASPLEAVRTGLEEAGRTGNKSYVKVIQQTFEGKKGAALREAITFASKEVKGSAADVSVIGFQELEKVDMFRHWHAVAKHMISTSSGVCVVGREDASFRRDYPLEQYHSETFGNMYLDSLGAQIGLASIDWLMGPVAFRSSEANHWINFDGEMWDAQIVPLVQAHLAGAHVSAFYVDYHHPKEMKEQEQGSYKWIEKRLMQLNFMKDTVARMMMKNIPNVKG